MLLLLVSDAFWNEKLISELTNFHLIPAKVFRYKAKKKFKLSHVINPYENLCLREGAGFNFI